MKTKQKKLSEIDELKKRIDMLEAKILLMEAQRQYPQMVPYPALKEMRRIVDKPELVKIK